MLGMPTGRLAPHSSKDGWYSQKTTAIYRINFTEHRDFRFGVAKYEFTHSSQSPRLSIMIRETSYSLLGKKRATIACSVITGIVTSLCIDMFFNVAKTLITMPINFISSNSLIAVQQRGPGIKKLLCQVYDEEQQ